MLQLEQILTQIEALKETFKAKEIVDSNWERKYWEKLRLEWNHGSNSIEGNTLTYAETVSLILKDITSGLHEFREYEEIKAHDLAIYDVKKWSKETRRISVTDICNLNQTILLRDFYKEAITENGENTRRLIKVGKYKEQPNSVQLSNGEMFHYASPQETPIKMKELMDWFNLNQTINPIVLAAEFHHRFILIHPFDDGNGRVSRLLVNYILMQNDLPPIVIKKEHKKQYLLTLRLADAGNIEPFISFLGDRLIWSLELGIKAKQGVSINELGDWKKKLNLLSSDLKGKNLKIKNQLENNFNTYVKPFIFECDKNIKDIETSLFVKSEDLGYYNTVEFIIKNQLEEIKTNKKSTKNLHYNLQKYNNGDSTLIIRIYIDYSNDFIAQVKVLFDTTEQVFNYALTSGNSTQLADQLSNDLITFIASCKKDL